jgi:hypothetical protein
MRFLADKIVVAKSDVRLAIATLRGIRKLIAAAWVTGDEELDILNKDLIQAVKSSGDKLRITNNKATHAYCLLGALRKVDGPVVNLVGALLTTCVPGKDAVRNDELSRVLSSYGFDQELITGFNDDYSTTQGKVLKVIDKAIAKLMSVEWRNGCTLEE